MPALIVLVVFVRRGHNLIADIKEARARLKFADQGPECDGYVWGYLYLDYCVIFVPATVHNIIVAGHLDYLPFCETGTSDRLFRSYWTSRHQRKQTWP